MTDLVKYLEEKVSKELEERLKTEAKAEPESQKKKKKKGKESKEPKVAKAVEGEAEVLEPSDDEDYSGIVKPEVFPGDEVRVHVLIKEVNPDTNKVSERIQIVPGMVIRVRGDNHGLNFTVRRIASHGIGVERTFLFHSPRIKKIDVLRHSKVRRAQLYYMRDLRGKKARLKEIRVVNRNK